MSEVHIPPLIQDLPFLKQLDTLRTKARDLRNQGLATISSFDPGPRGWDSESLVHLNADPTHNDGLSPTTSHFSATTRLYFRRAKHLAWNLGILDECDDPDVSASHSESVDYPSWPVLVDPAGTYEKDAECPVDLRPGHSDHTAVFTAATWLRTRLGNLPGHLDRDTLYCYYSVIRELYTLKRGSWAVGGARAGSDGEQSAFVTSECARAIGFLSRLMQNTADLLAQVKRRVRYINHVVDTSKGVHLEKYEAFGLLERWGAGELERCRIDLQALIHGRIDYVAIRLPVGWEDGSCEEIAERVLASLRDFLTVSEQNLRAFIHELRGLRVTGQDNPVGPREAAVDSGDWGSRQWPPADLTESARRIANSAIIGTCRRISATNCELKKNNVDLLDHLETGASLMAGLAKWTRGHLAPVERHVEGELHRALFEIEAEGNAVAVHELAFAALASESISKRWDRKIYRKALRCLSDAIDSRGRFPSGPPFALSPGGAQYNVENAHVIRAFAQLAEHSDWQLSAEVVRRCFRYFEDSMITIENRVSWQRQGSGITGLPSLWVTSVSVLALHRLVSLLDRKINQRIALHFTCKTPQQLKEKGVPNLNQLVATDLGYSSLPWKSQSPGSVLLDFQLMRTQLIGGRAKSRVSSGALRSIVLYGPPGTGKTTLFESLAVCADTPLIVVTPGDFLLFGTESLEGQANAVMSALGMLTHTLILFDEFDSVLHTRDNQKGMAGSALEFLPGNMLPKLADLSAATKRNHCAYGLATNYLERLDSAAIREGRFDQKRCVFFPDAPSRACRLISEVTQFKRMLEESGLSWAPIPGIGKRLAQVVRESAGIPVSHVARPGWLTAPKSVSSDGMASSRGKVPLSAGPVWDFLMGWSSSPPSWPKAHAAFTSKPPKPDATSGGKVEENETATERKFMQKITFQLEKSLRNAFLEGHDHSWAGTLDALRTSEKMKRLMRSRIRQLK